MICLGIETSCDETALALVGDDGLMAATLASQAQAHAIFGGVVPELAGREHYRHIGPLYDQLLARAKISQREIDCVCVARGPGLLGSLLVGVSFAKALALGLGRPVLGVNHLHAHLLAAGLSASLVYPAIGLLVSGGHTHLYKISGPAEFKLLGRSLDDAAGEAFDKIGCELGFAYPAGREIDSRGVRARGCGFQLPRPYLDNENLDFSFSGLKTAAISQIRQMGKSRADWDKDDFCRELNNAVADTLRTKTERALAANRDARAIWLAGGVAANSAVRREIENLAACHGLEFIAPPVSLCSDNGVMVAYAGHLLYGLGYRHGLAFEAVPRGRSIPQDMLAEPVFKRR